MSVTIHDWERHPEVRPLDEGSRGSGERRGEAGVAFHSLARGYYPTCSLHGAMAAVGGEDEMKWRCLVGGCNVGATTRRPWRGPDTW